MQETRSSLKKHLLWFWMWHQLTCNYVDYCTPFFFISDHCVFCVWIDISEPPPAYAQTHVHHTQSLEKYMMCLAELCLFYLWNLHGGPAFQPLSHSVPYKSQNFKTVSLHWYSKPLNSVLCILNESASIQMRFSPSVTLQHNLAALLIKTGTCYFLH